MGDVYTVAITAILLFPWSLVGVILAGAAFRRGRPPRGAPPRGVGCRRRLLTPSDRFGRAQAEGRAAAEGSPFPAA